MEKNNSQQCADRSRAAVLAVIASIGNNPTVLNRLLTDKDLIVLRDQGLLDEVRYLQSFTKLFPFFADWLSEEIQEASEAVSQDGVTSMLMEFCDVVYLLIKFQVLNHASNTDNLLSLISYLIGGNASNKIKKDWNLIQDPIIYAIDQWNDKNECRGRQIIPEEKISGYVLRLVKASRTWAHAVFDYSPSDDQPQSQVDGLSLPTLSEEVFDHD